MITIWYTFARTLGTSFRTCLYLSPYVSLLALACISLPGRTLQCSVVAGGLAALTVRMAQPPEMADLQVKDAKTYDHGVYCDECGIGVVFEA